MEQDKISCSILFLMFWGQIGVKFNFFRKMNHFIYCENTNKKARSLDKVPKLRAFPRTVIFQITVLGNARHK